VIIVAVAAFPTIAYGTSSTSSARRERFCGAAAQPMNKNGPRILLTRAGKRGRRQIAPLSVRNIDLPEAIIFYDTFEEADWSNLIKQCRECGTAVIVVESGTMPTTVKKPCIDQGRMLGSGGIALRVQGSVRPPNPKDLCDSLKPVMIQPKPFGGSSGFGASRVMEPPRSPLPSRAVVIGPTTDHSQAARYAGMRVVSVDTSSNDDDLADAVLTVEEIQELWLEDLATPGSFWLNPPHPRDRQGNRVDPERVILSGMQDGQEEGADVKTLMRHGSMLDEPSEDDLDRILADLSPL
jgi:hypothetical protein